MPKKIRKRKSVRRVRKPAKGSARVKRAQSSDTSDKSLRQHLVYVLGGGGAHIDFERSISNLPADLRGVKPEGLRFTAWGLLEHMRIAQWDILEFSRNARHVSPEWPGGYWPQNDAPPNDSAWDDSVRAFRADLQAMEGLVQNPSTDLFARIPHGDGQTILREALLVADHNAYHFGQMVVLRRLLRAWQES